MTIVRKSKIKKILSFELLIHPSSTKIVKIKVVGVLCNYKLHIYDFHRVRVDGCRKSTHHCKSKKAEGKVTLFQIPQL